MRLFTRYNAGVLSQYIVDERIRYCLSTKSYTTKGLKLQLALTSYSAQDTGMKR